MSANDDLLRFVLQHGDYVSDFLRRFAGSTAAGGGRALQAAGDLEWLVKVNRRDWSHEIHTADCLDDGAEAVRRESGMTQSTVEANHKIHMRHVERVETAMRRHR